MSDTEHLPQPIFERNPAVHETNWTESAMGRILATGLLLTEISPLNEVSRLVVFGAALKYGDPIAAAILTGAATMAIESGGAIITADMLDTDFGRKQVEKINNKLESVGADKLFDTNLATEAGVAMIAGSAVVTALKHRQNPGRSRADNRKYGLKSSAGIAVMSTIQAIGVGEGIRYPSPLTIGLAAVAVGASVSGLRWAAHKVKDNELDKEDLDHRDDMYMKVDRVTLEVIESETIINHSVEAYESMTQDAHGPQRLGLSVEETYKALKNPEVIKSVITNNAGEVTYLPFLVPVKDLYWYNNGYLTKRYGTDKLYYFAHASGSFGPDDPRAKVIESITAEGGIIIYDVTRQEGFGTKGDLSHLIEESRTAYIAEKLGGGENGSFLNQYEGIVTFDGNTAEFKTTKSIYEHCSDVIQSGQLEYDPKQGPAIVDSIVGDEAEQIWGFYNAPFVKLSEKHPIGAGYDKETFLELLEDPNVFKCVNRQDGRVTTLSMYVNDLKKAPWLNEQYYADKYPDAYQTGNLFVSLGIVADESVKTGTRMVSMVSLIMKALASRDSAIVLAFECNEISAKYTPRVTQFAVNHAGPSHIAGIRDIQSQLNFYGLRRSTTNS